MKSSSLPLLIVGSETIFLSCFTNRLIGFPRTDLYRLQPEFNLQYKSVSLLAKIGLFGALVLRIWPLFLLSTEFCGHAGPTGSFFVVLTKQLCAAELGWRSGAEMLESEEDFGRRGGRGDGRICWARGRAVQTSAFLAQY